MKLLFKYLLSLILITSLTISNIRSDGSCTSNNCACVDICEQECPCALTNSGGSIYGRTTFVPRSQGSNLARQMMGVEEKIHKFGNECFYGVASLAFEYQQTFSNSAGTNSRNSRNIGLWFSSTGNTTMSYGMNNNQGSNPLSFDLNALNWGYTGSGTIQFCPRKSDIIFDLNLYLGLDELFCGMWLRFDVPVARTKFNIGLIDKPTGAASSVLPSNLYGATTTLVYTTFASALLGDEKVGDLPALKYAKICGAKEDTSLANLRLTLGYDWFRRECWHFASAWLFVLPIGTRPTGEYVFEPIVGNYRRFEVGTEVNFAYELWHNCDSSHTLTFFADGYINWIVPMRNKRTFSILPKNATEVQSTWSQYLMLKKYNSSNTVTGQERVANISTGDVKIGADAVGAGAILFQWNCNCLMSGIGYEIWGRSHEKIKSRCFEILANTYALQGVSQWNGVEAAGAGVANNQNASTSTISVPGTTSTAFSTGSYLTNDNLNFCSASHPMALSNKIWGFVGYNWNECDWQPFILVGGEAEFGTSNSALSQWGIIGKGGITF